MTLHSIFRSVFLMSFALGLMASAQAQTPAKPTKKLKTLSYTCRVLYEPARALWVRELEIDYDRKAFQALRVDGVKAHGFSVNGASIITHLDNERIVLDLNVPSWKSQFREAALGQGVCIKNR
jgi:diacylglycerol kinase family enzyme